MKAAVQMKFTNTSPMLIKHNLGIIHENFERTKFNFQN